jgi:hypothetical protein
MLIVWIIIGIAGIAAVMIGLFRFAATWRSDRVGEDLPTTPLERLGWIGLWVTAAVGAGMVVLVAINGATRFYENDTSRGIFTILLLVGIAVWAAAWRIVSRPRGSAVIDERDRDILARSFSVESVVVIVSLVLWTVVLTEVYWDEGAIPIGYLQLIFWSTFILGAFGRSLGIVLGYRREPMVDA